MTRYTPRTKTFTIPDMVDRFPGSLPPGNPPDGYVITFSASDGYYIAKPPSKLLVVSNVASTPYSISTSFPEDVVLVSHAGAFTVNLPTSPFTGTVIYIKDFTGNASAFNITVSATQLIDGGATYTISTNFGTVRTVFTGGTWAILSKF